jgi:hypothetical protein
VPSYPALSRLGGGVPAAAPVAGLRRARHAWLGPASLTLCDVFSWLPLTVPAFEGNKAETRTMLPVIEKFMAAHGLPDVTVVADADMISEASQKAIEAAVLIFGPPGEHRNNALAVRMSLGAGQGEAGKKFHPERWRPDRGIWVIFETDAILFKK